MSTSDYSQYASSAVIGFLGRLDASVHRSLGTRNNPLAVNIQTYLQVRL